MKRSFPITILFVAAVVLLTGSCKDLGNEVKVILPPFISRVSPAADSVGREITIDGGNFGATRGNGYVLFSSTRATAYRGWNDSEIKAVVPNGATSGLVNVVVNERVSNGVAFQVLVAQPVFGVPQPAYNLLTSDSTTQTITGGTQPYTVIANNNPSAVAASISGVDLVLRGLGAGAATIVIGDSRSLRDTILVTVTATVLLSRDIQPIFESTANGCTGCHGGSGGLFLTAGQAYANLVNVQAQAGCTTLKRVLPGDANASVLYKRVTSADCGSQMPKGRTPLTTAEIQKIRDWINQGARNN